MTIFIMLFTWILFTILMSALVLGGFYIILWFLIGPLVGLFVVILFIIINILLLRNRRFDNPYRSYFNRSVARLANRILINIKVEVVNEHLIPSEGAVVAYANHKSYIDPFVIASVVKRPNAYTPKDGLYKIPIIKTWITQIGCMKVVRGDDRATLREMLEAIKRLEQGFFMTVFPEGGRRNVDSDLVEHVLPGAFKLAQKSKSTILPMTIVGNSMVRHNAPFRRTHIKLIIHEPITYDEYKDLKSQDIANRVTDTINKPLIN